VIIRQSDLASFQRCAQEVKLRRLAVEQGWAEPALSATLRGSVLHYAFMVLARLMHEGREDALEVALATFEHYWDPRHITELEGIDRPVDEWIGTDTWGGLLQRSLGNLRAAAAWLKRDKAVLLGLEHSFDVPIVIDGEEHTLHGTVDMLNLRMVNSRPELGIDDLKGYRRKKTRLDRATQWTVYSYASLQPQFWVPFYENAEVLEGFAEVVDRLDLRGLALYPPATPDERTVIPRVGRLLWAWDGFEVQSTGYRTDLHYAQLRAQLREYIGAVRHGVWPLTVDAHVCDYCPFGGLRADGSGLPICGDAPIPPRQEGIQ
jgi:hypothetical protein